jgi:hypothetical protein
MKIFLKILLIISILFSFNWINNIHAVENLDTWFKKDVNNSIKNNKPLDNLKWNNDFGISRWWEKWIYYTFVRVAKDWKNILFFLASLYLIILVIRLLFKEDEEEQKNFKKWIIWTWVWLVITQIAYTTVITLYDKDIWESLAWDFANKIINPLINLLETWASFFFIGAAIYAFFKLITSNWDEEKAKTWKMSIFYAIVWFIIIKLSKNIVAATYWVINCDKWSYLGGIIKVVWESCIDKNNLNEFALTIIDIINWVNSLIAIVVVILIIYTWAKVMVNTWDEERLKKAKTSIIYIAIWLFLLFANYLILTFFFLPETTI